MSGIDALLERLDSQSLDGLHEVLVRALAQFQVCGNDLFYYVGDLPVRHRRPQQGAELRFFVSASAERDLVELLSVLLDAQNADMADMMMAAGIDAARNVDVQTAKVAGEVEIAEPER